MNTDYKFLKVRGVKMICYHSLSTQQKNKRIWHNENNSIWHTRICFAPDNFVWRVKADFQRGNFELIFVQQISFTRQVRCKSDETVRQKMPLS